MSDLVNRQDALEAITNTRSMVAYHDASESVLYGSAFRQNEIIDIINALPSVEPKTGKWKSTTSGDHYKCSVCGYRAGYWFNEENSCEYSLDMSEWLSDFCPNCGARMTKGGDDE